MVFMVVTTFSESRNKGSVTQSEGSEYLGNIFKAPVYHSPSERLSRWLTRYGRYSWIVPPEDLMSHKGALPARRVQTQLDANR